MVESTRTMTAYTLISIPQSPFVEKARFILDLYSLPYEERTYLPFYHLFGVWMNTLFVSGWRRRKDRDSTPYSVPILMDASSGARKRIVSQDSKEIATLLASKHKHSLDLHEDNPQVQKWDELFSTKLGGEVRAYVQSVLFEDPSKKLMFNIAWTHSRSIIEYVFYRTVAAVGAFTLMKKMFRISTMSQIQRHLEAVEGIFDQVEEELSDGREFLTGDEMTLADISFATLGALAICVTQQEGAAAKLPSLDDLSSDAQSLPDENRTQVESFVEFAQKWRGKKAGKLILKVYERRRGLCARTNDLSFTKRK